MERATFKSEKSDIQYFLLYLLTMAITICLHKIGNVYEFNCKYGDCK